MRGSEQIVSSFKFINRFNGNAAPLPSSFSLFPSQQLDNMLPIYSIHEPFIHKYHHSSYLSYQVLSFSDERRRFTTNFSLSGRNHPGISRISLSHRRTPRPYTHPDHPSYLHVGTRFCPRNKSQFQQMGKTPFARVQEFLLAGRLRSLFCKRIHETQRH